MKNFFCHRSFIGMGILLLVWGAGVVRVQANPYVNTVSQGTALITGTGSAQVTINQTSPTAFIKWTTFDINSGETVTFNQPSAASVTWNQINGSLVNPSTGVSAINGTLTAYGYVILQNQNGFVVGGSAVIKAHNLVMTTASTPALDLSSGGPWSFNLPPPSANTATIVNLGQINIIGGGSAYLIANDIENSGTISAPGGKIGLYAGQTVLVSSAPNGLGLSAKVTLPQGSVDNNGNLTADGGTIAAQAQLVNQNGMIQANTAQNVNGTIELVAGDPVNASDPVNAGAAVSLGAGSVISASGGSTATTPNAGGSVIIQSGNSFSDQNGSAINVAGGTQGGGNGGQVTISAPQMTAVTSTISAQANAGFTGGSLAIDTSGIALNGTGNPVAGALALNVNALSSGFSQINLQAVNNIELSSPWTLGNPATVSLLAGNTIMVDSGAKIETDAGKIVLDAPTVNQNGTLSANSIGTANGVVEIDAGNSLTLGAGSVISASGQSSLTTPSPGGFVVLNSANSFSDTAGPQASQINVAGGTGTGGGQNGIIEIFGSGVTAATVQSIISSYYAYLINPRDIFLSSASTSPTTPNTIIPVAGDTSHPNPYANLNLGTPNTSGVNLGENVGALSTYSQIDLLAMDNINLNSLWNLGSLTVPISPNPLQTLGLSAGNNVNLNSSLNAGNNWNVNLTAGTSLPSGTSPTSGNDGIYLNGGTYLQTQNGNINVLAANEVMVGSGNVAAIRTMNGGNIAVTATSGDVNAGSNPIGYQSYDVNPARDAVNINLGGISTAAGGNVSITAGGDVISYSPSVNDLTDAVKDGGSGAFGSLPGNVTIVAGGNVYGNYVEGNGSGSITSLNGNVGDPNSNISQQNIFALNLISGSWTVNAPNGDISLQEVRNPNGDFNAKNTTFNYASDASVTLNAGNAVEIWGDDSPGNNDSVPRNPIIPVPVVFPPILNISAGAGGFTMFNNITLFQSPDANLNIITTDNGSFTGIQRSDGTYPVLYMSDSSSKQWSNSGNPNTMLPGNTVVSATPYELNNPNYGPAIINISDNLKNVNIYTVKETQLTVGGNLFNAGFAAQNVHPTDVTSVTVGGQIFYSPLYAFAPLGGPLQPNVPSVDEPAGNAYLSQPLDEFFYLLVNPAQVNPDGTSTFTVPSGTTYTALNNSALYPNLFPNRNPDGQFNNNSLGNLGYTPGITPGAGTLSYKGPMSPTKEQYLEQLNSSGNSVQNFYVVKLNAQGFPVLSQDSNGKSHLVLDPVSLVNPAVIQTLYTQSQNTSTTAQYGLQIGGPGQFNITAGAISLGDSDGIESWGIYAQSESTDPNYSYYYPLSAVTPPGEGAAINVTTLNPYGTDLNTGDQLASMDMVSSRIASWYGGDVSVTSKTGGMNLGTQEVLQGVSDFAYGIFSIDLNPGLTGHGNVTVEAFNDINVAGSRIAAFNGGDVTVTSDNGSVNVGSGGNTFSLVLMVYADPANPLTADTSHYSVYGSGIVAESLPGDELGLGQPASYNGETPQPGNITVTAHQNITADTAGILQIALDGSVAGGPTVTLNAGDKIDLGTGGLIGGTVNATAPNISGLIISRQNSTVNAAQSFSGVVLSGGQANLNAGSANGVVIGIGGINSSVGASGSLALLSQNVSAGGQQVGSTFATATASATTQAAASSSSQASQQVASNGSDDDDKKKKPKSGLARSVGRVTVVLPKAS
jgi:filamentous hemagglutinin family protein